MARMIAKLEVLLLEQKERGVVNENDICLSRVREDGNKSCK